MAATHQGALLVFKGGMLAADGLDNDIDRPVGKELVFAQVWESSCSPPEKLAHFIRSLITVMLQDRDFHRLMQREIMEANPERLQLLAQGVFKKQFCLLMQFAAELAPALDAYLVATSIIGLIQLTIDCQPLHRYFPGHKPEHDQPDVIAAHITTLLLNGLNRTNLRL